MEGARTWDRQQAGRAGKAVAQVIWDDVSKLPKHDIAVEDPNPPFHIERNPLQSRHAAEEAEAIAAHLKRSLEDMVVTIFNAAKGATDIATPDEPLKVRWVEAYFPFTSPSWELEVFWQGDWLEVLGCGVVSQAILDNATVPNRVGWAFGIGLERIAMLLYGIPDIRLFRSKDTRFLSQFSEAAPIKRFVPFSKYPACFKDVSFWLRSSSSAAGGASPIHPPATTSAATPTPNSDSAATPQTLSSREPVITNAEARAASPHAATSTHIPRSTGTTTRADPASSASDKEGLSEHPQLIAPAAPTQAPAAFHENDVMEIAREVCGDLVEDVRLTDEFVHPKTGRKSLCYRINYRSLERTLTNDETNAMHERLRSLLVDRLGVELR
jgi:phenylalanyl-tRNA synthetase alpha chain